MKKTSIVLLMSFILSGIAYSQYYTGEKLLEKMESMKIGQRMFALGYLTAVVDTFNDGLIAIPDGVSIGHIFNIVHAYLEDLPGQGEHAAAVLVYQALEEHFPLWEGDIENISLEEISPTEPQALAVAGNVNSSYEDAMLAFFVVVAGAALVGGLR